METESRPLYYYLIKRGETVKIARLTDTEAMKSYKRGTRWIGVGYKTLKEAELALKDHLSG